MSDERLMTDVVASNPNDETAQLAIADAITERTGDYPAALSEAKMIAIRSRIETFVKYLDEVLANYWADRGHTFSRPPTHRADYISGKWCRIVQVENQNDGQKCDRSVAAFVSLADNSTRELGAVKTGDIHMSASWKKPAKHARGSVWSDGFGKCVGTSGRINYLR